MLATDARLGERINWNEEQQGNGSFEEEKSERAAALMRVRALIPKLCPFRSQLDAQLTSHLSETGVMRFQARKIK
jgi:hypothetical protein